MNVKVSINGDMLTRPATAFAHFQNIHDILTQILKIQNGSEQNVQSSFFVSSKYLIAFSRPLMIRTVVAYDLNTYFSDAFASRKNKDFGSSF